MTKFPINVLWGKWCHYNPHTKVEKHEHSQHYQISYVMGGDGIFASGKNKRQLAAGQMMFCQPGEPHSFAATNEVLKTMEFKFLVYESELKKMLKSVPAFIDLPSTRSLVIALHDEGIQQRKWYRQMSNSLMYQILIQLMRSYSNQSKVAPSKKACFRVKNNRLAQMFEEIIQANYSKDLSLKDIANMMGYNVNYLCTSIKKIYGYSVIGYLYNYRLQVAREMIIFSELSISQIASNTGFKTVHHFSRLFKEKYGFSPREYRKKEKEGIQKDIFFDRSFKYQNYVIPGTPVEPFPRTSDLYTS